MVSPLTPRQRSPAVYHWLLQRVSAVLLIPMALWFVAAALPALVAGASAFQEWLSPLNGILALFWTALLLFHGCLGMEAIFQDYVPCVRGRDLLIMIIRILTALALLLALFCLSQTF